MDSQFDEAIAKINLLGPIREQFQIRAELLPADLAIVGLYTELRESAFLAVELCRLHAQSAAFPLARTVFEATQQLIVLATEDDYLSVGTRAWLYDLRKRKRVAQFARGAEAADDWFQQAVGELQRIWTVYNPNAEKDLHHENTQLDALQKNRGGADNFMGRNIGKIVEERYSKLAVSFGKSAAELSELNSGIYTALSRVQVGVIVEKWSASRGDGWHSGLPRHDSRRAIPSRWKQPHVSRLRGSFGLPH